MPGRDRADDGGVTAHAEQGLVQGRPGGIPRGDGRPRNAIGTAAVGGTEPIRPDVIFGITSMTRPVTAAQSQTSVELADLLVTRYPPGARIGWYRDAPQLGEVGGVSLPAACRMRFRRGRARALGGDSLRRGRTPQAGPDRARRRAPSAGGLTGSAPRRDHGEHTPRSSFARRRRHQSPGPERSSRRGRRLEGYPPAACPPRWSSSAARAHAVVVSVRTPAEVLMAARRLAGARPHLAAVAGIVPHEDLWQLCRDELTGADVRTTAGITSRPATAPPPIEVSSGGRKVYRTFAS